MKRPSILLITFLLSLAAAQGDVAAAYAAPLRFAYATEALLVRLQALALGAEPDEDDGAEAGETSVDPLDLFAGSLGERAPELLGALESALDEVQEAAEAGDGAGLEAAAARAQALVTRVQDALIPPALHDDPAFRAAVMARLALSDDGPAEGYEEAAEGEEGAYYAAWAALQREKALWAALEPAVASAEAKAEIRRAFAVMDELMPDPEPPAHYRDPEDAEVAVQDLVFALEAALGQTLQPRDLLAVLALVEAQARAACAAFEAGQARLGLERALGARLEYDQHLGGTAGLLAPETHQRVAASLQAPTQAAVCTELPQALEQLRATFGG